MYTYVRSIMVAMDIPCFPQVYPPHGGTGGATSRDQLSELPRGLLLQGGPRIGLQSWVLQHHHILYIIYYILYS